MDSSLCKGVTYSRLVNMNMIRKDGENYIPVTSANMNWSSYPVSLNENKHSLMNEHYDVLTGTMPETPNDLMLVVDTKNRINKAVMKRTWF